MATETTKLTFVEGAAASTPAAGRGVIYFKADGLLYSKDDAGVETLCSAGSAGIAATIFDAKGDIIAATAADTAARLAVGANNLVLMAASGETTGLKWAYPLLTTIDATLGADVTMTTGGTWYDGPSASFAAGTWAFWWHMLGVQGDAGIRSFQGRIVNSDASTEYDYSENTPPDVNGYRSMVSGGGIAVLGSTTTLKLQGRADDGPNTMSRNGGGGTGNFATRVWAVRVV